MRPPSILATHNDQQLTGPHTRAFPRGPQLPNRPKGLWRMTSQPHPRRRCTRRKKRGHSLPVGAGEAAGGQAVDAGEGFPSSSGHRSTSGGSNILPPKRDGRPPWKLSGGTRTMRRWCLGTGSQATQKCSAMRIASSHRSSGAHDCMHPPASRMASIRRSRAMASCAPAATMAAAQWPLAAHKRHRARGTPQNAGGAT